MPIIESKKLTEYLNRCELDDPGMDPDLGRFLVDLLDDPYGSVVTGIKLGELATKEGKNIFAAYDVNVDGDPSFTVFIVAASEDEACDIVQSFETYEKPESRAAAPEPLYSTSKRDPFLDALDKLGLSELGF